MAEPGKIGKSWNDIRKQFDRIRAYEGYGDDSPLYNGNPRLSRIYYSTVNNYLYNINKTSKKREKLLIKLKQEALSPNRDGERIRELNKQLEKLQEKLYNKKFPKSVYAKKNSVYREI